MLSAEIISALIKWSWWIKPGINNLYYFIVGGLDGKESRYLKGYDMSFFTLVPQENVLAVSFDTAS